MVLQVSSYTLYAGQLACGNHALANLEVNSRLEGVGALTFYNLLYDFLHYLGLAVAKLVHLILEGADATVAIGNLAAEGVDAGVQAVNFCLVVGTNLCEVVLAVAALEVVGQTCLELDGGSVYMPVCSINERGQTREELIVEVVDDGGLQSEGPCTALAEVEQEVQAELARQIAVVVRSLVVEINSRSNETIN